MKRVWIRFKCYSRIPSRYYAFAPQVVVATPTPDLDVETIRAATSAIPGLVQACTGFRSLLQSVPTAAPSLSEAAMAGVVESLAGNEVVDELATTGAADPAAASPHPVAASAPPIAAVAPLSDVGVACVAHTTGPAAATTPMASLPITPHADARRDTGEFTVPSFEPPLAPFEYGREEAEVVLLGTGSAVPSKYRNVSSSLLTTGWQRDPAVTSLAPTGVRVPAWTMVLDAGEGTLGQLYRRYGHALETVLRSIGMVFISHMHADHHLGVVRLILAHNRATRETGQLPLMIVGPRMLTSWLRQVSTTVSPLQYRFTAAHDVGLWPLPDLTPGGVASIRTVRVIHCYDAYGLVIDHTHGWRVTYSGDTRPCPQLAEAGRNSTVLLHEATFADELACEALTRKHCTVSEAIAIGTDMRAKHILLTHFSQRYPKMAVLDEDLNVGIGADFLAVPFWAFPLLPRLTPALQLLFADSINEDQSEGRES